MLQNAYHLLRSGGSKAKDEILYAYHYDEKAMRDLFRTVTALNGEPAQAGDICQRALFKGDNYAEGVHPDCRAEKSPIGIRFRYGFGFGFRLWFGFRFRVRLCLGFRFCFGLRYRYRFRFGVRLEHKALLHCVQIGFHFFCQNRQSQAAHKHEQRQNR